MSLSPVNAVNQQSEPNIGIVRLPPPDFPLGPRHLCRFLLLSLLDPLLDPNHGLVCKTLESLRPSADGDNRQLASLLSLPLHPLNSKILFS